MQVVKLRCAACDTEVQGTYRPCPVCCLEPEARKLMDLFLDARGNLAPVTARMEKCEYHEADQTGDLADPTPPPRVHAPPRLRHP